MATMNVKNAAGGDEAIEKPLAPGRAAATASRPVSLSNEDLAALTALATKLDTLIGGVGAPGPQNATDATAVIPANTSNASKARILSAATTNTTSLKTSAGVLRSLDVYNEGADTIYLKLYDKNGVPNLAADVPFWTIPIPANSGFAKEYAFGVPLAAGLSYAITLGPNDTDTTATPAGSVTGFIVWK